MMSAENMLYNGLQAAFFVSLAVLFIVPLRRVFRRWLGARATVHLWWLVPVTLLAIVVPPRTVETSARQALIDSATTTSSTISSQAPNVDSGGPAAWLLVIWLGGTLLYGALVWMRHRRLLNSLQPMRRYRGAVWMSGANHATAMLVGFLKPRIVLPDNGPDASPGSRRRLMLTHEIVHLRRNDPLWNAASSALCMFFWFNPVVHWAATRFRLDQELACDETVLEKFPAKRRMYASALLEAVPMDLPAATHAFGANFIKERIMQLTVQKKIPASIRRIGTVSMLVLVLATGVLAWAADPEPRMDYLFSVDITVTVDGEAEKGIWSFEADESVMLPVREGGKPIMIGRERMSWSHEQTEGGWAANAEIAVLEDDRFEIRAQILENGTIKSSPRMIVHANKAAYMEGRSESGSVYRVDFRPITADAD